MKRKKKEKIKNIIKNNRVRDKDTTAAIIIPGAKRKSSVAL